MADKRSFVLYLDMWDLIEELSIDQRGILLTAIYAVQSGEEIPKMDKETRIVFKSIKNSLVRDKTRYEEMVEKRRKAGQKGAEARWGSKDGKTVENSTNEWQTIAKMADSDSDSDSDSDNVSGSDSDIGATSATTTTFSLFGVRENVKLTQDQYRKIAQTYQRPKELIDKVSNWLVNAKHGVPDHMSLIYKFATNDNWPKKPARKPPDPEPEIEAVPMPEDIKKKAAGWNRSLGLVEG